MQLQFNHEGKVLFTYRAVSSLDGIVGVTEGNGAPNPGETNFDPTIPVSPSTFSMGVTSTVYQQLTGGGDPFDLDDQSLYFVPHSADNGWNISRFIQ